LTFCRNRCSRQRGPHFLEPSRIGSGTRPYGEINDLKSLDEALELGVVKERGKGLDAL
jgi:hypothetical protein